MRFNHNIQRIYTWFTKLDLGIIIPVLLLFCINIIVQYSANDHVFNRIYNDVGYLFISLFIMFFVANLHYGKLKAIAVPLYILSILLLIAVLIVGVKVNGSQRWLNIGIRIQPSELSKLAVPLIIAYVFSLKHSRLNGLDYLGGFVLILIPFALIAKQSDLGTAILVFVAGFFVLFFAGLSWKIITGGILLFILSAPLLWHFLQDYQKQRIITLIDPQSDPLGRGYHVIQGIIAIGSGGFWGKGYLQGTQIHLSFIPEKHTDFVITVLAEEIGFIGVSTLLFIYLLLVLRGLKIMREADNMFAKTVAGSITMSLMLYVLINMGMVAGIFPVVGVPLPLISYGGTATIVLMIGFGILLSIDKHNRYD